MKNLEKIVKFNAKVVSILSNDKLIQVLAWLQIIICISVVISMFHGNNQIIIFLSFNAWSILLVIFFVVYAAIVQIFEVINSKVSNYVMSKKINPLKK